MTSKLTAASRVGLTVGILLILLLAAYFEFLPRFYHAGPTLLVKDEYYLKAPTQPHAIRNLFTCQHSVGGWSQSQGALYGEEVCGPFSRTWSFWPLSDA